MPLPLSFKSSTDLKNSNRSTSPTTSAFILVTLLTRFAPCSLLPHSESNKTNSVTLIFNHFTRFSSSFQPISSSFRALFVHHHHHWAPSPANKTHVPRDAPWTFSVISSATGETERGRRTRSRNRQKTDMNYFSMFDGVVFERKPWTR